MSQLIKKSVTLRGHRTSIALEKEFWAAIAAIARLENRGIREVISEIDESREKDSSLASAIRLRALAFYSKGDRPGGAEFAGKQ